MFENTIRVIALLLVLFSLKVIAHSEHDKARFVSDKGVDQGYCDNALRPCKTIAYAVQQANKGDKVLVASGQYHMNSAEELFDLKSELVPILAGFNRFDHFQTQSPDVNPTFLTGVPSSMAASLRNKGFRVIDDGKSQRSNKGLQSKMRELKVLNEAQSGIDCVSGMAGSFPCQNIDLVAHIPLSGFSSGATAGNDVWGHIDLNTGTEYAIMGVQNGITVFSLSDPESPVEVGHVLGNKSGWRDIKVYQYFDQTLNAWQAYAYATVENADGVSIINLNNLPNSVSLVEANKSVSNSHNVYISNVDHSLNIKQDDVEPVLQIVGANKAGGAFNSFSLANPQTIQISNNQSGFGGYTHDGTSVLINDSRKDNDCFNATTHCSVFVDFNVNEMVFWDISNPADTKKLSQIGYDDVPLTQQYIHSGWVTEDKRYVLLHDEFDESKGGLNTTIRIFQIDSLRNPVKVGQWTGPTKTIDHNGFVRGNRYYMSNYERGLTILDITDAANPVEVGFFDTFPTRNSNKFNGAWGVYPFLPSGLILVSDINSGLYILRDKTQSSTQGSVQFDSAEINVSQGADAQVSVSRVGSNNVSTSVSVKYEVISGSAQKGEDFTAVSGELNWVGNESGVKTFNLPIAAAPSSSELKEKFYVRLYDPTSGLTLTSPSYLTVNIDGALNGGSAEFAESEIAVDENGGDITITVNRVGGSEGEANVSYQFVAGTAIADQDYVDSSGTLTWTDGDNTSKSFVVNLIDDVDAESKESFTIELTVINGIKLGTKSVATLTVSDDETNTAPSVIVTEDFEANTGQMITLSATVTDAENDSLTYLWQQTGGASVTLNSSDQPSASFVAPSSAGALEFSLTVTDTIGASSTGSVTVNIVAPPVADTPNSSSGGGAGWWVVLLTALLSIKSFSRKYFLVS
ncbi:choice-of-anchor B family protein [Aliikangiella sp. IMCC44359]|uniref:choice-of-anchor B family protein n=1 Tax=Aliikangiella sp. IMCC44359 TaxID=3459125 RepID=UPI00403B2A84